MLPSLVMSIILNLVLVATIFALCWDRKETHQAYQSAYDHYLQERTRILLTSNAMKHGVNRTFRIKDEYSSINVMVDSELAINDEDPERVLYPFCLKRFPYHSLEGREFALREAQELIDKLEER